LSLTAAACGQKEGVATQGVVVGADGTVTGVDPITGETVTGGDPVAGGPGTTGGTTAGTGGAGGTTGGTTAGTGGAGGTTGGTTAGTGGAGGTTGGTTAGTGGGGGKKSSDPTAPQAGPGDSTGVTKDSIKIGVHAPVTGAAAIPSTSFERGVGAYFKYMNERGGFHGRKVQVFFEDDGFDPAKAVQKCSHLIETEKVFMIFGGAGSDQIEACGRYAASRGVPYLSAGVHERSSKGSLGDLPSYFAGTLTYEQQAPVVTRIAKQVAGAGKVTLRVANNESLTNYYNVQGSSLAKALGNRYVAPGANGRIPKDTSGGDAIDVATKLCNSGADVVVWNASPSSLLNTSASMSCTMRFVGPGLTNGLNIVADAGCPKLNGARFLSPFPGMDRMRQNKEFRAAYASKNGNTQPDDLGAAVYAGERLIGEILMAVGEGLSREAFLGKMGQQKVFRTGVYPDTNFASRFGGTAMWDLQMDCGRREYFTVGLQRP
jgi:branched-chain amino acid transport system substrate-binding protein